MGGNRNFHQAAFSAGPPPGRYDLSSKKLKN